ncbi:putative positive regulator of sigma E, RseC/MucC [Treponema primitia ZAS-2]|uniref:Putative positive regulator of sigma E, RseC/MucC n=1 Tax=Treponema primitia (strain ATCC BAA-887 / DSM 12427 / ZAS-2) TaxID=545694 RepID=F5YPW8_TREPZ|nr:SoxR reducing system RseC family protein [Treponema primitia]AEF85814.1 putative positive regulator of sigma E, RseC/MucC [Treponema primitia ZAS-2]
MKETGVVVNIKGALATVKVKRPAASKGCCHFDTTKDEFLEAYNNCNAAVNDTVSVESEVETEKRQAFIKFGLFIAAFMIGLVGGYYVAGLFNAANLNGLFSIAAALLAIVITHIVYKRLNGEAKRIPVINEIVYNT